MSPVRSPSRVSGRTLPREFLRPAVDTRAHTPSALSYCAAWISGNGCVPINHLMEDAATAEIARVQLWQWVKHGAKTADSAKAITPAYLEPIFAEEGAKVGKLPGINEEHVRIAAEYMLDQVRASGLATF